MARSQNHCQNEWAGEIDQHLNSAQVILLLVSASFLASDYCYDVELKRAMERHEAGEARVIPVILRPVDWHDAPFGKLQALPRNAKPVTRWTDRDEAFADVARGIRAAVESISGSSGAAPSTRSRSTAEPSSTTDRVSPDAISSPIYILFLAANPLDTDPLRLGEEVRTIDERLRSAQFRERFELIQHWAVRVADLTEYLLRHTPDIVHFSGHGSAQGSIILEDQTGNAQPVSPQALGRMFRTLKDNVRCVVLNGCFSATQAQAIVQEIDCVAGMSKDIGDDAAIQFAGGFYQALGYGRSVQTAFENGCNQIDLEALGEESTPQLLVKPGIDPTRLDFVPPLP